MPGGTFPVDDTCGNKYLSTLSLWLSLSGRLVGSSRLQAEFAVQMACSLDGSAHRQPVVLMAVRRYCYLNGKVTLTSLSTTSEETGSDCSHLMSPAPSRSRTGWFFWNSGYQEAQQRFLQSRIGTTPPESRASPAAVSLVIPNLKNISGEVCMMKV